jgi:hypothetical protein
MKKAIIFVLFSAIAAVAIGVVIQNEIRTEKELKSKPIKFAYYKHPGGLTYAFVCEDRQALDRFKEFYDELDKGIDTKIPPFDLGAHINDTAYVINENADSLASLIAVFYTAHNGTEKHVVGYALKRTLHDIPLKR